MSIWLAFLDLYFACGFVLTAALLLLAAADG